MKSAQNLRIARTGHETANSGVFLAKSDFGGRGIHLPTHGSKFLKIFWKFQNLLFFGKIWEIQKASEDGGRRTTRTTRTDGRTHSSNLRLSYTKSPFGAIMMYYPSMLHLYNRALRQEKQNSFEIGNNDKQTKWCVYKFGKKKEAKSRWKGFRARIALKTRF